MIRRISSGGPYEAQIGYCRAVVHGGLVHVAGTTATDEDLNGDVVVQCRSALGRIGAALTEAGSGFEHALRVRYIMRRIEDFEPCWPLLRETFGDNPPAATVFEAAMIDPRDLIEIELDAALPDGNA